MLSNIFKTRQPLIAEAPLRAALALGLVSAIAAPAHAQISIGLDVGITNNAVCVGGGDSETLGVSNSDDCSAGAGFTAAPFMSFDGNGIILDGGTGVATFNRLATFNSQTVFNGVSSFTDTVSFSGANATFATPTTFTFNSTFQAPTTFNGTTNFTAGMTTTNITNSGTINSANVNVTGSFTAAPGTTINMGGVNRIQGVAAGINDLDAVNVAQLNAATSGITADVTALETTTATHTTQIGTLNTAVATQATQITALQAADAAFDTRVDTLELLAEGLDERIDKVDDRASAGTAAAVALSGAMFLPGKSFNLTGNVGSYRGAHAAALQFGALVSGNVALNAGIAKGFNKGGKTALRAGFTIGW
jgi:hypothetical protein